MLKKSNNGFTLYIDESDQIQGIRGAFYLVFDSNTCDSLWGYYCSNCSSFNKAVGPIWKLVCSECANFRKSK